MKIYKIKDGKVYEHDKLEWKSKVEQIWAIIKPEELEGSYNALGVNKQTVLECKQNLDIPKIDVYDKYDFGLLHVINEKAPFKEISKINFYISKEYLIFIVSNPVNIIKEVEKVVLENSEEQYSIDRILYMVMEHLTQNDMLMLDTIEEEIEKAEELVIRGKPYDYTKIIIHLRKRLLFLRRHYEPLCDLVEELEQNSNSILEQHSVAYFKILSKKINRLNMRVISLSDYVTQVREASDAQIDIRLNKIMKIFTVITTIFLPLTLIVGWYGMNFQNMPELNWEYGYMYVIVLSIVVVIISIIFFKRKHFF